MDTARSQLQNLSLPAGRISTTYPAAAARPRPPPQVVEVAAVTGQGLGDLEEALLLQAELMELQVGP